MRSTFAGELGSPLTGFPASVMSSDDGRPIRTHRRGWIWNRFACPCSRTPSKSSFPFGPPARTSSQQRPRAALMLVNTGAVETAGAVVAGVVFGVAVGGGAAAATLPAPDGGWACEGVDDPARLGLLGAPLRVTEGHGAQARP